MRFAFVIGVAVLFGAAIKFFVAETGETMDLHVYAERGDSSEVRRHLDSAENLKETVNAFDDKGMTPLMYAATSPDADASLVSLLIEKGAEVNAVSRGQFGLERTVLSHALGAGDPEKVAVLLGRGADLHYRHDGGYDAIIDAVHGRDITRDARLVDLLSLLIAAGAPVDGRTKYCESGLRVTSNRGRFDAVRLLLDAGVDANELNWTPLMHAVTLGTLDEVRASLNAGESLEARDSWKRTPLLLAIQTGSIDKVQSLIEHGANLDVRGHFGRPILFYAIGNGHWDMLRWLLDMGIDPKQADESGSTALITAAEYGDLTGVDLLLEYGAKVDGGGEGSSSFIANLEKGLKDAGIDPEQLPDMAQSEETALSSAGSREVALRLLAAGADPAKLGREARRQILGLDAEPTNEYRLATRDDFLRGRYRRFGRTNPEETHEPFWIAMVRSGVNAWMASQAFEASVPEPDEPVWCADRFGQSITLLPDGRVLEIGGEHEDWYDPDFCIYNDVIVHDGNSGIRIFSYPESVFPPTDFHTATLVGQHIYIIGSLGYAEKRRHGETPVYRLDLKDFHIETIATTGEHPGWISNHRAHLVDDVRIQVSGGSLSVLQKGQDQQLPNRKVYVLDLNSFVWSIGS